MTRSPAADAVGGKGKQRASTTYDGLNGSSFEAVAGETAGRPAMLSPETARLGDTHARTSRFLRKSKSKQQLQDTQGTIKSLQNDGGKWRCVYAGDTSSQDQVNPA